MTDVAPANFALPPGDQWSNPKERTRRLSRTEAIHAHCRECLGLAVWNAQIGNDCDDNACDLWIWRPGNGKGRVKTGKGHPSSLNPAVSVQEEEA